MIAAQKEQKTLRVENSHESEQLAESSYVKLTIGILQSIVEKMEASQPTQKVISLYFKWSRNQSFSIENYSWFFHYPLDEKFSIE